MRHEYTPEDIAFIKKHYNVDMLSKDIAARFGITPKTLKGYVRFLKDAGHEIARQGVPVGTIRTRRRAGGTYTCQKQEDGSWKYISCTLDERVVKGYAVGEVRIRNCRGHKTYFTKTATGWKQGRRVEVPTVKQKQAARPMPVARIPKGPVKRTAPKDKRTVFETGKNPDTVKIKSDKEKLELGYVWVQLDHRTKVLRAPHKLTA